MAPHSSTFAWKIPWMEEPGRLQSIGSRRVGHLLSDFTFTFHFHALEKEMATHSSVLAWRIPGTGEPGGLPSMGSHIVGHDWSDLAAAAAVCESQVSNLRSNFLERNPHQSKPECQSESESRLVVSDFLQPQGLYSPWNTPGQNTRVGNCSLFQGIFQTQRLNSGFPHCRWILYQLSHKASPPTLKERELYKGHRRSSQNSPYLIRPGTECY